MGNGLPDPAGAFTLLLRNEGTLHLSLPTGGNGRHQQVCVASLSEMASGTYNRLLWQEQTDNACMVAKAA
jgi:hypothetical protein